MYSRRTRHVWVGAQNVETQVTGPNDAGIYDVTIAAPIEQMDDIDAAIATWNVQHPDAIIPPDDWLPR
jgi:hypothetical protein